MFIPILRCVWYSTIEMRDSRYAEGKGEPVYADDGLKTWSVHVTLL